MYIYSRLISLNHDESRLIRCLMKRCVMRFEKVVHTFTYECILYMYLICAVVLRYLHNR